MTPQSSISDHQLIERICSGDSIATNLLVKKWHVEFCNRAYYILKDADLSKDVTQKSWIVILEELKNLKDPTCFKFWAFRIIYNKSMDALRNNKRLSIRHKKMCDEVSSDTDDTESKEKEVLKEQLKIAINNLSQPQQMVIRLFYVQEYRLKEIAELLSISEGTVKSRLYHAREHLKKELKRTKNNYYERL